jgi:hypothetical protein
MGDGRGIGRRKIFEPHGNFWRRAPRRHDAALVFVLPMLQAHARCTHSWWLTLGDDGHCPPSGNSLQNSSCLGVSFCGGRGVVAVYCCLLLHVATHCCSLLTAHCLLLTERFPRNLVSRLSSSLSCNPGLFPFLVTASRTAR